MNLTEEDKKLIDTLASKIVEWRMSAPAVFLLESFKPLNFVGSQLMIVFRPFLSLVPGIVNSYSRLQKLLEQRESVEILLEAIEEHENKFMNKDETDVDGTEAEIS